MSTADRHSADEELLGADHPEQVAAELQALAAELRRVLAAAVQVRPLPGELAPYVEQARALADGLGGLSSLHALAPGAVARPYDPNRFSPVSGSANAIAPPLELWRVTEGPDGPEGRHTQGRVRFGPAYEGPPGHVHGAMVAAMYDDLLGRSQLVAGFTGSITISFRRPTPLHRDLDLRAWVDRVDGRKRWVHGSCHLDGVLLTEAEGLFVAPRGGATLEGIVGQLAGD
jgi:hypothetical protein